MLLKIKYIRHMYKIQYLQNNSNSKSSISECRRYSSFITKEHFESEIGVDFRGYTHTHTHPLRCGTNGTEVLTRSYFETEMYWDRYLCI